MFMKVSRYSKNRWGFSLIEVLATVLIMSLGVLAVVRMQMTSVLQVSPLLAALSQLQLPVM